MQTEIPVFASILLEMLQIKSILQFIAKTWIVLSEVMCKSPTSSNIAWSKLEA